LSRTKVSIVLTFSSWRRNVEEEAAYRGKSIDVEIHNGLTKKAS
jgi:hypothetical protein